MLVSTSLFAQAPSAANQASASQQLPPNPASGSDAGPFPPKADPSLNSPAELATHVRAHENALLEYLPDPLIPFAGCRYAQDTVVELEDGAGLFWWETVAPGREARGEVFSYDTLRLSFHLRAAGAPIAIERNDLNPSLRPLSSMARLGPYRYFSSFYICRAGIDGRAWQGLETSLLEIARQR